MKYTLISKEPGLRSDKSPLEKLPELVKMGQMKIEDDVYVWGHTGLEVSLVRETPYSVGMLIENENYRKLLYPDKSRGYYTSSQFAGILKAKLAGLEGQTNKKKQERVTQFMF